MGRPRPRPWTFSRPIGDQIPVILDGYRRVDNVTDATLASYREHYGDAGITKEDIFFYVYALLHHPEYRERYEDDLKKILPHIPRAAGFHTYASVGRELADLHVNYERVEPYPSVQEEASLHAPADPWERYRIGERKMRFPKLGRRDKDFTRLEYNDYVTLTGIPAEAQGYSISGRSPLEWIIDRYHVKTDKASGIVNDPNDFLREQGRPDAVVDLIKRLVTVSMRTQELLATLPKLEIPGRGRAMTASKTNAIALFKRHPNTSPSTLVMYDRTYSLGQLSYAYYESALVVANQFDGQAKSDIFLRPYLFLIRHAFELLLKMAFSFSRTLRLNSAQRIQRQSTKIRSR